MHKESIYGRKFRNSLLTKASAFLLAFFVLIPSVSPLLAQEAQVSDAPSVDTSTQNDAPVVDSGSSVADPVPVVETPIVAPPDSEPVLDVPEADEDLATPTEENKLEPAPLDPQMQAQGLGVNIDPDGGFTLPSQLKADVDLSTGALVYKYPITLTKGRGDMTPDLSLNYNSRNATKLDSITGLGWEVSIPYIKRAPLKGTNNLYTNAFFVSSESGNLIATTDTTSSQFSTYRPESDDGSFLKYTYNADNSWSVKDKDGKTYTYGAAATSRQDNPADATQVYKWMLSSVTDLNGNSIQYTYTKDSGQIYPDQINYTQHASSPAVNNVTFAYTTPSSYGATLYDSAFPVTTYKLLSTITGTTTIGPDTSTHTYTLNYGNTAYMKQMELTSVYESGSFPHQPDTGSIPPTTFAYTTKTPGWNTGSLDLTSSFSGAQFLKSNNIMNSGIRAADFDKNGYPDLLISYYISSQYPPINQLMMNNGSTFTDSLSAWGLSSATPFNNSYSIGDVNGDDFPDLLGRYNVTDVYINTGSSFTLDTSRTWDASNYVPEASPSGFCAVNTGDKETKEHSLFLFDINGDKKNDLVYFGGTSDFRVLLNNGNGWSSSSAYTFSGGASNFPSMYPCDSSQMNIDNQQVLLDVNGDGLADYINQAYGTFLNTGTGFVYSSAYSTIKDMIANTRAGVADINGDGLVDLVQGYRYHDPSGDTRFCNLTYLNNGKGFTMVNPNSMPTPAGCPSNAVWPAYPIGLDNSDSSNYAPGILLDVNSDGLPDAVSNGFYGSFINSMNDAQSGWTYINGDWINAMSRDVFVDLNADGIIDYITPENNSSYPTHVQIGNPSVPNMLSSVTNILGGTTSITYGAAPVFTGADSSTISVVKNITVDPHVGQPQMVTSYNYSGGTNSVDPNTKEKRFAGFQKVTATESGADLVPVRVTDTYFHQANGSDSSTNEATDTSLALIGKPYYSVVHNSANTLKKETWNKYGKYTLATEPVIGRSSTFVYSTEEVSKVTDPSTSYGAAKVYTTDTSLGEQTSLQDLGFVTVSSNGSYTDTGSDTKYEYYTYATNGTGIVKPAAKDVRTSTSSGSTVSKSEYYYDNQPLGTVGALANLTKQSDWVSGNGAVKADSAYTYDTYGNILTITNPIGALTTYTYDLSNSRPVTSKNHLTQITTYTYYAGKLRTVTDPNSRVTTYGYNNVGWLQMKTVQNTGGSTTEGQNLAGQTAFNNVYYPMFESTKSTGAYQQHSWNLIDGLGRPIRSIPFEINDTDYTNNPYMFITSNTGYDSLGRATTQAVPVPTAYVDVYWQGTLSDPIASNLITTTTYDIFDRPTAVSNVLGTTTYLYAGMDTTVTDANNHQKKTKTDARGNLVEVKEYGASTYTTAYAYDIRNLLKTITDANGNVRNFTYNNAGWLINSEDVHGAGDSAFGSTQFTYDVDGNILTETEPSGVVISRVYDMLDRMISVSDSAGTGNHTFTYDSCTNGIGRVCGVSSVVPNGVTLTKSYAYGISGQPTSVSLTTLGNTYTTLYDYTPLDQIKRITYPNGTIVRTDYGFWSLPAHTYVTLPAQAEVTYATYTYHGPTQKIAQIDRLNGPSTFYTYDPLKLWRLSRKLSTSSGASSSSTFVAAVGDGELSNINGNWDNAHDAATATSYDFTGSSLTVGTGKSGSSYSISRSTYPFDTSSLPDNANVTSAVLRFYVNSKVNGDNDGDDWITVVKGTQASGTALSAADYVSFGATNNPTEGIDVADRRDITNIGANNWQTFNLNLTGLSWVNPTGYTKLGLREGHDVIDSQITLGNNQYNSISSRSIERGTGTPTLDVTYNTNQVYQDSNYVYDNVGNIVQINEPSNTKAYAYDNLDRLTQAVYTPIPSGTPTTYSYTYDAIGNVLTANGNTYSYDTPNKTNPHAVTRIGTSASYAYDDNGNLTAVGVGSSSGCVPPLSGNWVVSSSCTFVGTSIAPASVIVNAGQVLTLSPGSKLLVDLKHFKVQVKQGGGILIKNTATLRQVKVSDGAPAGVSQTLTYNWQNQPTRITLNGTINIDSSYDESGNRFLYKTPTNTEIQVTDDYLLRNAVPEISLKLGDIPVGTISNNAFYGSVSDNLNTPVKQISSAGTASEVVTYDPFGKVLTQSGTLNTKDGYTGHEEDIDTGLVYAQARYYNPASLRFNQQDPSAIYIGSQNFKNMIGVDRNQILLDPQQLNSYSYVRNNPINGVDPDGKSWTTAGEGFISPITSAFNHPLQTAGTLVIATALAVAAPVALAVGGAAIGGYSIGSAIYNATMATDTDQRDYYLGQGLSDTILTAIGIKAAGSVSNTSIVNTPKTSQNNFFEGSSYSPKVQKQMIAGDRHSFPELVRNYVNEGKISKFRGGDGEKYTKLTIQGEYNGLKGQFEFIKNKAGVINHRYFNPKKN